MARQVQVPRGQPIFREEDCSPLDIGVVLKNIESFSDPEKLHFIENVWWSLQKEPGMIDRYIRS